MSEGPQTLEGGRGGPHTAGSRPRWPGAASLFVIGAVYAVLREDLRVAPAFLLLVLVGVLLVPALYAQLRGRHHLSHLLGLALRRPLHHRGGDQRVPLGRGLVHPADNTPDGPAGRGPDLASERVVLCRVVLGDRGGRAGKTPKRRPRGRGFPVPPGPRRCFRLVPGLRGLPVPRLQPEHGLRPHGHLGYEQAGKILSMTQAIFSLLIIAVVVARATAQ